MNDTMDINWSTVDKASSALLAIGCSKLNVDNFVKRGKALEMQMKTPRLTASQHISAQVNATVWFLSFLMATETLKDADDERPAHIYPTFKKNGQEQTWPELKVEILTGFISTGNKAYYDNQTIYLFLAMIESNYHESTCIRILDTHSCALIQVRLQNSQDEPVPLDMLRNGQHYEPRFPLAKNITDEDFANFRDALGGTTTVPKPKVAQVGFPYFGQLFVCLWG